MRRNKRLFCILLGGVCTTAVLLVLLWPNAQDPRVRGARLSHHLRAGYAWNEVAASLEEYHQKTARQNQASIALLECGTNAFPLLTRWLRATPRELSPWVVKLLERSGSFGEPMLADRRAIALNALLQNPTLLERGQPLIRPLAHCLTNDGARAPSLAALNILLAFATPAPEEIESIQRMRAPIFRRTRIGGTIPKLTFGSRISADPKALFCSQPPVKNIGRTDVCPWAARQRASRPQSSWPNEKPGLNW